MRRLHFGWAMFAMALAGCTGSVDELDFRSGSRLKARYVQVDQTRLFRGFHDSLRGEDCAFGRLTRESPEPDAMKVAYCLPVERALRGGFADPGCVDPVVQLDAESKATVVVDEPSDPCGGFPVVTAVGQRVSLVFDRDPAGVCAEVTPAYANGTIHRLGAPLPLETFVRADERRVDLDGRLSQLRLEADDGARRTIGAFDDVRGESVSVQRVDVDRWTPSASASRDDNMYSDSACTEPVAVALWLGSCPATAVATWSGATGCDIVSTFTFHEVGGALDVGAGLHRLDDGSCVQVPDSTQTLTALGAPIPPSALVEATAFVAGSGKVRQQYWGGLNQVPLIATGRLEDTVSGEPCEITRSATDGKLRCYPSGTEEPVFFEDPACGLPLLGYFLKEGCAATHAPQKSFSSKRADGEVLKVFAVDGEVLTLASAFRRNDGEGDCFEVTFEEPTQFLRLTQTDETRFTEAFEKLDP